MIVGTICSDSTASTSEAHLGVVASAHARPVGQHGTSAATCRPGVPDLGAVGAFVQMVAFRDIAREGGGDDKMCRLRNSTRGKTLHRLSEFGASLLQVTKKY